jgi:outer membrane protein OmpA-like peptidoglycan-associated protein
MALAMQENVMRNTKSVLLAAVLALAIAPLQAVAQDAMTAQDIQQKLKPKKLTRSLKPAGQNDDKQQLDNILSRSIGIVERKKIVEIATHSDLPKLDFSINFDFDSADIDPASYPTLDTLAEALKSQDLYASRFLINGHTDSKGSDDYNLELSQRRANAVVQYLVSQHDVEPNRLKAIGFGETTLKDVNDGEAAVNRRVEIINRP